MAARSAPRVRSKLRTAGGGVTSPIPFDRFQIQFIANLNGEGFKAGLGDPLRRYAPGKYPTGYDRLGFLPSSLGAAPPRVPEQVFGYSDEFGCGA